MDAIEAAWTQVEAPQTSGLAVRSSDLQPAERLDLVPVIYDNLPAQYQTRENYRDLELRARQDPKSLDRAIELTGQSIPQLVHYNNYNLTETYTTDSRHINNFQANPKFELTIINGSGQDAEGWWFWGVILGFLLLVALLLGGE